MTKTTAVVVDGQFLNRAGLAAFLRKEMGFSRVTEFGTVLDALEFLRTDTTVSIILLDMALDVPDSIGTIARIRSVANGAAVAVFDDRRDRVSVFKALEEGAAGFIPRGLDEAQMRHALDEILRGYIFVPPGLSAFASAPASPENEIIEKPIGRLTERQRQVLDHLSEGKSNKEIARALCISESTVKVHVAAAFRLLGVKNRVSAVAALRKMRENLFRNDCEQASDSALDRRQPELRIQLNNTAR